MGPPGLQVTLAVQGVEVQDIRLWEPEVLGALGRTGWRKRSRDLLVSTNLVAFWVQEISDALIKIEEIDFLKKPRQK